MLYKNTCRCIGARHIGMYVPRYINITIRLSHSYMHTKTRSDNSIAKMSENNNKYKKYVFLHDIILPHAYVLLELYTSTTITTSPI